MSINRDLSSVSAWHNRRQTSPIRSTAGGVTVPVEQTIPGTRHGLGRLARGWLAAALMTSLAAGGHSLAHLGAQQQPVAPIIWVFTLVLTGPICTALAGRRWSRLRTLGAVGIGQIFFHLLFTLFGAAHGGAVHNASGDDPLGVHAHHVDRLIVDSTASAATMQHSLIASVLMWVVHLLAAFGAYWLTHHGEAASYHVVDALVLAGTRRLLAAMDTVPSPPKSTVVQPGENLPLRRYIIITHTSPRGPPALSLAS